MDEKLTIASTELAGFLIRLGVMTRFPAVFGKNLAVAMGVNEREDWFGVRVAGP